MPGTPATGTDGQSRWVEPCRTRSIPAFQAYPLRLLADAASSGRARELGVSHADFRFEAGPRPSFLRLRDGRTEASIDRTGSSGLAVRVVRRRRLGVRRGCRPSRWTRRCGSRRKRSRWRGCPGRSRRRRGSGDRVEMAPEPVHPDAAWVSAYDVGPGLRRAGGGPGRAARAAEPRPAGRGTAWTTIDAMLLAVQENKFYTDTAGTTTTQQRVRVRSGPRRDRGRRQGGYESMRTLAPPARRGWEYLTGTGWDWESELAELPSLLAERVAAPSVEAGSYDLVIDPSNLWLTIHESIGRATELLDRGDSATRRPTRAPRSRPSTSWARCSTARRSCTSPATRTAEHGLATIGYDDEGVATQSWGPGQGRHVLAGYQLDRNMARMQGFGRLNGLRGLRRLPPRMCRCSGWPACRCSPPPEERSTAELIGGVERGLYVVGDKSWSIDMQRYNFQFTGQRAYRIENGRLAGQVKDFAYQATTTDFWGSMEARSAGPSKAYVLGGAFHPWQGAARPGRGGEPRRLPVGAVPRGVILNTVQEAGR
ncbi:metallopeptidase TldD-related protein [Yinghuangia aomiensis]